VPLDVSALRLTVEGVFSATWKLTTSLVAMPTRLSVVTALIW
jgi:hypothetical protein